MTSTTATAAVLLVNLGTPADRSTAAVRRFLAEFLADPRVVELPRWVWWPILYGVILPTRPRRSAEAYAKIWTDQGSPLLVYSRALAAKIGANAGSVRVELAMRYGEPSIASAIVRLHRDGVRRLLVLPMYPQYSAASTGTVFDRVAQTLQEQRWPLELRFISDYHADAGYIDALAASVEAHWQAHGRAQKLLLSFHGIPQKCVDRGDPYFDQCLQTARHLRERLKLTPDEQLVTFQSRVGRAQWLSPYTDVVLETLPREGTKSVQVLCPGFSVDCLETLEEIAIRGREQFEEAGGERYEYIPALNDTTPHVDALRRLIAHQTQGWNEFDGWRDGRA
ncbi:MAG TPA: ferrochelatase [Rudaea sp.]